VKYHIDIKLDGKPERGSTFLATVRNMPTANTEGKHRSKDGI
jgi:hypothetical protein